MATPGVSDVMIAGGTGAVSALNYPPDLRSGIPGPTPRGINRYATAAAINGAYFPAGSSSHVFLATGTDFLDALGGAAVAGLLGAPLFTTSPSRMPASIKKGVENLGAGLKGRVRWNGCGQQCCRTAVCVAA